MDGKRDRQTDRDRDRKRKKERDKEREGVRVREIDILPECITFRQKCQKHKEIVRSNSNYILI